MLRHKYSQNVNIKPLYGNFREQSFWLKTLPEINNIKPLTDSLKCDIAIIGGGFTGLSAAYHLRLLLPGVDVRVIEANICGFGASGRNGGFSGTLFGMDKDITALRFGKINTIAAHHYMEDAVDYLEKIIVKHNINCDYEKKGSLFVATTATQIKRLDHKLYLADRWGLEGIESWDEKRLHDEFQSNVYRRGMFDRRTGLLNPALFTRGLAKIARKAGATIYEMSPVTSIKKNSKGFCICTPEGELQAEKIIFASNAYSILFPGLSSKQIPVFQNIIVSEPLSIEQIKSIGWQSRCGIEDARNQLHYYRLTSDNRLLIGGGSIEPVFKQKIDHDSNKKVFTHLKKHVLKIFPQLTGLKFTHQWGGPVSITIDMAPYNGLCLAELLAGKKSKRTEMFFVGRRMVSWPPQLFRYPLISFILGMLKVQDRFYWD